MTPFRAMIALTVVLSSLAVGLEVRDHQGASSSALSPTSSQPVIAAAEEPADPVGRDLRTAPEDDRPNIVLVITDDQRYDEMQFLPRTERLLGEAGLTATEAITPHPLCCPARAEMLTGQLAQNNGVQTNFAPQGGYDRLDTRHTLATWLQDAGYNTAFLGKHLNGYSQTDGRDPGWNIFNASSHGFSDYVDFHQYDNGRRVRVPGYYTDYVSQRTVDYAHELSRADAPFFLWVSHFAPHAARKTPDCLAGETCTLRPPLLSPAQNLQRAVRGRTTTDDQAREFAEGIAAKPSYNERDVSDKQHLVRSKPRVPADQVTDFALGRAAALDGVDRSVDRLVAQLAEDGELDNTYLVFVTDNGYQLGEHRFWGKVLPYEENLRTPLLVRGPGVEAGTRTDRPMTLVDLAPTFLDIAGARADLTLDGVSMLDLWQGEKGEDPHRGGLLIQAGAYKSETGKRGWLYRGVRTERYTYARFFDGFAELYDRERDPYEVDSVAEDPAYAALRAELDRRTRLLQDCAGPQECNRDFGPLPAPAG